MKYSQITKQVAVVLAGVAIFASCKKSDKVNGVGDSGNTIVKVMNGGTQMEPGLNKNAIDFVATPQTVTAADLRRDIPNNAELNKKMTITVSDDTAAFRMYNDVLVAGGGSPLERLPDSWYTINTPLTGGEGGNYTITLESGDFAKSITVTVPDATVLDPATSYGLAFTITSADAGSKLSAEHRTVIMTLGAKNPYDGVYNLHGKFYHPTSAPTYPWYEIEVEMWTVSANAVKMFSPDFGGFYHPWSTGSAITAFSAQEPRYTIDVATNAVVVDNSYVPAASIYSMGKGFDNAGYNSHYDPLSKTIFANFGYNLGAGGTFLPASSRMWVDTLNYLGPR